MKAVSLSAFARTKSGRREVKRIRAASRVPAVIYGRGIEAQSLELRAKAIEDLIHHSVSETILVDLAVEGEGEDRRLALVQEVQHHPLSGIVLHVDFHQVALDEKVTVTIPVESIGEAAGVKLGGVLEHVLFRTRVRGLPKDLPEALTVDVSHLEMGDTIQLSELALPDGVEVVGDTALPVFSVAAPRTEIVETATDEEEAAEPEATKEKKEASAGEGSGDAPASKA